MHHSTILTVCSVERRRGSPGDPAESTPCPAATRARVLSLSTMRSCRGESREDLCATESVALCVTRHLFAHVGVLPGRHTSPTLPYHPLTTAPHSHHFPTHATTVCRGIAQGRVAMCEQVCPQVHNTKPSSPLALRPHQRDTSLGGSSSPPSPVRAEDGDASLDQWRLVCVRERSGCSASSTGSFQGAHAGLAPHLLRSRRRRSTSSARGLSRDWSSRDWSVVSRERSDTDDALPAQIFARQVHTVANVHHY